MEIGRSVSAASTVLLVTVLVILELHAEKTKAYFVTVVRQRNKLHYLHS